MNTNNFRTTAFLVILAIVLGSPSWAGDKGGSYPYSSYPAINEVLTEFGELEQVTLVVSGHNFLRRWGRTPYVSLGNGRAFTLLEATDNDLVILADLPDGDYLLRISHDKYFRDSKTAAYNLTVGMIGPEGLAGPQGDPGQPGIDGPLGLEGPPGPVGLQGLAGPQGSAGLQGDQGTQGEPGVRGKDGVDGPPGDKGDKGDAGALGNPGPVAQHYWDGTKLSFQQSENSWSEPVDLQGKAAPGFEIQQACTLAMAMYQDSAGEVLGEYEVPFTSSFEKMTEACFECCPEGFKQRVNELIEGLESEIPLASPERSTIQSDGTRSKVESTSVENQLHVAILEILAAVVVPHCKASALNRVYTNRMVGCLKAINTAQMNFREGDKEGDGVLDYAISAQELYDEELIGLNCLDDAWGNDWIWGTQYDTTGEPRWEFIWHATSMGKGGINNTGNEYCNSQEGVIRMGKVDEYCETGEPITSGE